MEHMRVIIECTKAMKARQYKKAILLTADVLEGGMPEAVKMIRHLHRDEGRNDEHAKSTTPK
jgi:hypothetical protein